MDRVILRTAAALLAFGMASAPARAGDREVCDKGSGEDSIAACSRLIQRNPRDAVAYRNRGVEYWYRHDYDRAMADLNKAIALNPKYARGYGNRAAVCALRGDAKARCRGEGISSSLQEGNGGVLILVV
jgi:tetratricopeptide (TPR) repeat protein